MRQHFTVTTHFDASGQIALWYIDICLLTGVGQNQIPWLDDLYLDLVVSPSMEVEVKDADELLAARESGEISTTEFNLAWCEADRLMESISRPVWAFRFERRSPPDAPAIGPLIVKYC